MIKRSMKFSFLICLFGLVACSPIKSPVNNQYQLIAFNRTIHKLKPSAHTLLITMPEAMSGYQTEQMKYIDKPFELNSFAYNAWISPPAEMLFPLLLQSLQDTGYFYAIASGSNANQTDYRLDTQLIALNQSFLTKPSTLTFTAKLVLTHTTDNQVMGSCVIHIALPCNNENPYGGVITANEVMVRFTRDAAHFVITTINKQH